MIERPVLARRHQLAVGESPHPSGTRLVQRDDSLAEKEGRSTLVVQFEAGVVEHGLPRARVPQDAPARGSQPGRVGRAVDRHGSGGSAEHLLPGAELADRRRAVHLQPHQTRLVREVHRVGGGRGPADHPTAEGVGLDRLGRILPPRDPRVEVDDEPHPRRRRDHRGGRIDHGIIDPTNRAGSDVVPQHGAALLRVAVQDAGIIDRDRVGRVLRPLFGPVARAVVRIHLRRRAVAQATDPHRARVGEVRHEVACDGDIRRPLGS